MAVPQTEGALEEIGRTPQERSSGVGEHEDRWTRPANDEEIEKRSTFLSTAPDISFPYSQQIIIFIVICKIAFSFLK